MAVRFALLSLHRSSVPPQLDFASVQLVSVGPLASRLSTGIEAQIQ